MIEYSDWTFVIAVALGLLTILFGSTVFDKWSEKVGISLILGGFSSIVIFIIYGAMHQNSGNEQFVKYLEKTVISSEPSITVKYGSFSLGSGTLENIEYYYANILGDDGAIDREYIPVKRTSRYIDDELKETARYFQPICTHKKNIIWRSSPDDRFVCQKAKGKLYIPRNTIITHLEDKVFQ